MAKLASESKTIQDAKLTLYLCAVVVVAHWAGHLAQHWVPELPDLVPDAIADIAMGAIPMALLMWKRRLETTESVVR